MKFLNQEVIIDRIDITDQINNEDFNPSQMHFVTYLQSIANESEPEAQPIKQDQPQYYDNIQDIKEAAEGGKLISLSNLCQLVGNV